MAALADTHAEAAAAPPLGPLRCIVRPMAKAPVQVHKTCSRSCNACAARDEVAACCQPHGHAVPRFMDICDPRSHHTMLEQAPPDFLLVVLPW